MVTPAKGNTTRVADTSASDVARAARTAIHASTATAAEGDRERQRRDERHGQPSGVRRQQLEAGDGFPKERERDDCRDQAVERGTRSPVRRARAVGHDKPTHRVCQAERDPRRQRDHRSVGQGAKQIRSAERNERPADERKHRDEVVAGHAVRGT
jgi:hypothetical protein